MNTVGIIFMSFMSLLSAVAILYGSRLAEEKRALLWHHLEGSVSKWAGFF